MKVSRRFLITGAVFVGLTAPAMAIIIPPMVPDICGFGTCVQFTQSAALASIQNLYNQATQIANQVTSLKNESTNLNGIGNLAHQAISQNVGRILQRKQPQQVGDDAAGQVAAQVPDDANDLTKIDAQASGANGAQQQAQLGNLYMSTIAGEAIKGNAMAAQEQLQRKNEAAAEQSGLSDLFSGSSPAVEQP